MEPAVGEALRRGLGLVPIALHDVGALDPELAHLVRGNLLAPLAHRLHLADGHRQPHALGLAHVVLADVEGRDRGGLGEPVAVAGRNRGKRLLDAAHELGRGGRAAIAHGDDAGEIPAREARRLEHLPHHGRHPAEAGEPLALDQLERPLGVPLVHHHELPAEGRIADEDRVTPRSVEEGHGDELRLLRTVAGRRKLGAASQRPARLREGQTHQVRADVAVGAERALGLPRRAGGVEDRGLVVGVECHVGGRGVRSRRSDHILEALEARRGPARGARHHHRPQVEPAEIRRQHRGTLRVAEEQRGARVFQAVFELLALPPGV